MELPYLCDIFLGTELRADYEGVANWVTDS